MPKKEITTSDLRKELFEAIRAVKSGDLSPNIAHQVSKLAAQINENIYAEIRAEQFKLDYIADFGILRIGGRE